MARKKEIIDKKAKKRLEGQCRFCGESDYALLDIHRIVEGADGGRYTQMNTVVACANCHRRCHDGQIKIDRYYFSSNGKWLLHCWVDDEEKWL